MDKWTEDFLANCSRLKHVKVISTGTATKEWFNKKTDKLEKTTTHSAVKVLNETYNQVNIWALSGQHKPGKPFFEETHSDSSYVE